MFFGIGIIGVLSSYLPTTFISLEQRPSMSRVKNRKGRSKVSVGEAASRVGVPVYHYSE
jgi:hypothetical protein